MLTPRSPRTEAKAKGERDGSKHNGRRTQDEMPPSNISLGTMSWPIDINNCEAVSPITETQATMPVKLQITDAALGIHANWRPRAFVQACRRKSARAARAARATRAARAARRVVGLVMPCDAAPIHKVFSEATSRPGKDGASLAGYHATHVTL